MKKGNLAATAASKAQQTIADKRALEREQQKQIQNHEIALQITKARKKNEEAFPSKDIESLVEMAIRVVAANFERYPELTGVTS